MSWSSRLAPIAVLTALTLGFAADTAAAQHIDEGDAPSGRPAGYATMPAVMGAFPTPAGAGGPRHASGALRLGPRWRRDDGADTGRLRRCAASTVEVLIDARRLSPAQARGEAVLNAWFDWNRDGDWADADGCAAEWAIPNLRVRLSELGSDRLGLLPVEIRGGAQVEELWTRFTLTLGQDAVRRDGGGAAQPYTHGETEDILLLPGDGTMAFGRERTRRRARSSGAGGGFDVTCRPNPDHMLHGRNHIIEFRIRGTGQIHAEFDDKSGATWKAKALPARDQRGAPRGRFLSRAFRFTSTRQHTVDEDASPIETITVGFTLEQGSQRSHLGCTVIVTHDRKVKKKKARRPPAPAPGATPPPPGTAAPPPLPPPAPNCQLGLTTDPGPNGPDVDHVKLTANCNREIGTIEIIAPAGKSFVTGACAATKGTMVSCQNSGGTSTSTWNQPAGQTLEFLAQVAPPPPGPGTYRIIVRDKAGAVVSDETITLP